MGFLDYIAWYPKKHPGRAEAIKFLLIHIHTIFLVFVLGPIIAMDMKTRGYAKYQQFANEVYLLFVEDYLIVLALLALFLFFIGLFYVIVWRFFFKDYIRVFQDIPGVVSNRTPEGRIYWTVNHGLGDWMRQRRNRTRSPDSKEPAKDIIIWFNAKILFNIFFPLRSLQQMHGIKQGSIQEDGPFARLVHEHGKTEKKESSNIIFKVGKGPMTMHPVDVKYSEKEMLHSVNQFKREATNISLGDSNEIKEKYRSHSTNVPHNDYLEMEWALVQMGLKKQIGYEEEEDDEQDE